MEKSTRFVFAAAFVAAFLGACGPGTGGTDSGPMPMTDTGTPPDVDAGPIPPPDGGVDTGDDSGTTGLVCMYDMLGPSCTACECDMSHMTDMCAVYPDLCEAPAGMNSCSIDGTNRCGYNLPAEVMPYSMSDFACAERINYDTWVSDSGLGRTATSMRNGQLEGNFDFAYDHPQLSGFGATTGIQWTCGNMGRCWFNWTNPSSTHPRCWVRFWSDGSYTTPGCATATVDCFPSGTSIADAEAGTGMARFTAAWVMDGI